MKFLTGFLNKNRGMSLVEIVLVMGITGVVMLSIPAMMQVMNQTSNTMAVNMAKTELITKIRLDSINLGSIESSAKITQTLGTAGINSAGGASNPNFAMLSKCIPTITNISGCDKTSMDDVRGFKFYLAGGNSGNVADAVAGEGIFYTARGVKCTTTQALDPATCPIKTSVWAEPFCNAFKTTCSKAVSLTIRYRLEVRPEYVDKVLFTPQEGEVYVTLSKGIQLSRVLSQLDNPVQLNQNGIYSVQKYYGYADQANQPQGLRFEAILGNPTGLVSMRLQYRAISGVDVDSFLDDDIPTSINALAWTDVADPLAANTPWTVSLSGAKSSQIINFGTQTTATTSNNTNKSFRIGATTADTSALQLKYRWTLSSSNTLVAPTFLSGFYQFRVLATDSTNATIDSMNYLTVRIVPRPQFLVPTSQPLYIQNRNCISNQNSLIYKMAIADDESIGDQTVQLNTVSAPFTSISGRSGFISMPFELSQEINASSKNFSYAFTAKNKFTARSVNGSSIPISSSNYSVALSEKPILFQPLTSSPSKIRIGTTGNVTAALEMGSCCNLAPTVTWLFPKVPEVAAALLSGDATSDPTCNINSNNNTRICYATVPITGIKESPASTSSPDVTSNFAFDATANACTGGTAIQSYVNNVYIPVVKIPGIQFFLPESLWLTTPGNEISGVKSILPKLYVRADFQPDEDVTVGVYTSTDNSLLCSITFTAGTGTNPIDKPCVIPAGYSGDITLSRISTNIMIDTDLAGPSFRAKLISGKLNHRTCQANLQDIPDFADYTVPADQPMYNSPWGFTTDVIGNVAQDIKNDTGLWPSAAVKKLRCYDSWNGTLNGAINYSNSDLMTISTIGSNQDVNVQDIYKVHRYNTELKPVGSATVHTSIGSSTASSSKARYQTYIFPDNPNLDFDPKNAPYVFAIYHQGGAPSTAVWQFVNTTTGASSTTPPKAWVNYTANLCTGSATLSSIKIFGIKSVGHSTAETVMKATNNIYAGGSGYYSYNFMCAFGRWNPNSKASTSWSN